MDCSGAVGGIIAFRGNSFANPHALIKLISDLHQPVSHAGFGATVLNYGVTALFAAVWLVGAAAVWLLWRPASGAFFKPPGAPAACGIR